MSSPTDAVFGGDAHGAAEQKAVVDFLASGAWAGVSSGEVERMQTHGALVFLAADRVCKIKRPVEFPYMDFSTREKRRRACETEVQVNRRTAPALYLGAEPITRGADGRLVLGGDGEVLEWSVLMRRFPQEDLLDRMAEERRLTREIIAELADGIACFHAGAERAPAASPYGGRAALEATLGESLCELEDKPDWFEPATVERVKGLVRTALARSAPVLDRRKREGRVRRCHGDLHLGNICLIEGRPTLFDAIEFNESFAWVDVLHDLAFILMDLDHRGFRSFANLLFTRYLMQTEDLDGLGVLPLLMADRSLVRAKVGAATAAGLEDMRRLRTLEREARAYVSAAADFLVPAAPRLVAVGGLSGTGKSTLAGRLAPAIGGAPGAVHLRSDVVRKRLAGVAETERLDEAFYSAEMNRAVYARMTEMTERILAAGHSAVVDGVFAREDERRALSGVARDCGVPLLGLWLEAPVETLAARVQQRRGDASDATAEVVRRQAAFDPGAIEWTRLSAEGAPDEVESAARRLLGG